MSDKTQKTPYVAPQPEWTIPGVGPSAQKPGRPKQRKPIETDEAKLARMRGPRLS